MIPMMGIIFYEYGELDSLQTPCSFCFASTELSETTVVAAIKWHCHENLSAQTQSLGPILLMP